MVWRNGRWVIATAAGVPDLQWAVRLQRMAQVSLLGFLVGGAFLSLAYFDVPYYVMVIMVATRLHVERELKERAAQPAAPLNKVEAQGVV